MAGGLQSLGRPGWEALPNDFWQLQFAPTKASAQKCEKYIEALLGGKISVPDLASLEAAGERAPKASSPAG
jgi:hypothetical protein